MRSTPARSQGGQVAPHRTWMKAVAAAPSFGVRAGDVAGMALSLAFDPRGEHLAVSSSDNVLRLFRTVDGSTPSERPRPRLQLDLAWGRRVLRGVNCDTWSSRSWPRGGWTRRISSPRQRFLVGHGDSWLVKHDDGTLWMRTFGARGSVGPIQVPAGARLLACVPRRGALAQLAGGLLVLLTPHGPEPARPEGGLPDVAVSCGAADGGLLVVGGVTGHVEAWFGRGPVLARHQFHLGRVTAVAVSKERGLLAAGGQNWLSVVRLMTGAELWSAHGPPEATDVRFDDDDRQLICGFADGRVARWVPGAAPAWTDPPVPGARDEWVALDRRHAVAGRDRRMVVWRLDDQRTVFETATGSTTPWWPVQRPLLRYPWLVCARRGVAEVWNVETGRHTAIPAPIWDRTPVAHPDGRIAFATDERGGSVPWLDPVTGRWGAVHRARAPEPHPFPFAGAVPLEWSRRGLLLRDESGATEWVDESGSTRRWRLQFGFVDVAASTPGGGVVLAESQLGQALIEFGPDATTGKGLVRHAGPIRALAVSADGRWVASASGDGTVVAADRRSGRLHRLDDQGRP